MSGQPPSHSVPSGSPSGVPSPSGAPRSPPHINPDRGRESYYATEYPKQLWYFIASFIFLVAIFQLCSYLLNRWKAQRKESSKVDPELAAPLTDHRRGSIRRLPLALVNTYRSIAFRQTVSIGSYTLNLAEVFAMATYIVIIFTWTFINSKILLSNFGYALLLNITSKATSLSGHKLDMGYWGNRAGALAASQLPLITALGTKNNVVGCKWNRLFTQPRWF